MILEECTQKFGNSKLFEKIGKVLQKINSEVKMIEDTRNREILKVDKVIWSTVEIAQLFVAVFNLGDVEWFEIQKRINFESSGFIKTPN